MLYQIRVKGHQGCQWAEWFDDLTITLQDNGDCCLTGPVVDQDVLHGLLKKVRDLYMHLVSVNLVKYRQIRHTKTSSMKLIKIVQKRSKQ